MAEGPTIHPHPSVITEDWLAVYRELPAAILGRVIDEGFVDPKLRPIARPIHVVGTAITVRLPERDVAPMFAVIDMLRPDDVLVVDAGVDRSWACWGEPAALAAKARGCAGVIVDGAVTDIARLGEVDLPTFARGISARVGRPLARSSATVNAQIECGGVSVHPGDLIVADDDGVVVIPVQRVTDVAADARVVAERTRVSRRWLERGGPIEALAGLDAAGIEQLLRERGWA
ncbi:MAG: RraA family protein [Chloroflexota bacterium]|nr:RraA family protein [Chloroflexota bacterium]